MASARSLRLASVSAAALSCAWAHSARAQETFLSTPPPVFQTVDANSVDLVSGALTTSVTGITIGQPGAGGLSYGRNFIGTGWRDSFMGLVNVSSNITTISIGGSSEAFTLSGSVYTSTSLDGSTLTLSGTTYTYTQRDGTVLTFQPSATPNVGPWGRSQGRITQIVKSDGEVDTFNYQLAEVCKSKTACTGDNEIDAERLGSYSNNLGYEIDLTYQNTDGSLPDINTVYQVAQATAVNHAFPNASGMPSVSLLASGTSGTLTDALGRVQSFTYDTAGHLTGYTFPSGSSNTTTVTYDGSSRVSTLTNGLGAKWTYAYSGSATNQTTTVTDPLSHTRTVVSNPSTGLIYSDADGLGHVTRYTYDGAGRLLTTTTPNGIVTTLTYDGRGNITQKSVTAAGGSPVITTSATYDATCSNAIKCNQPNTTTDAKGGVSHYYYLSTAFLNTIVYPAGTDGTSQQVDWLYSQQYAWYYQGGTLAKAPSQVWRLNFYSRGCPTAQTCWSTGAPIQTIPGYTASGSPSNLLPISFAAGSRDGLLTATTSMTYDTVGNLYTTTDPLGNLTRYRYDAARQPVGVVGPDPDGGGPLKNRGLRYTYDGAGRVSRVDQGSVASQSDADWSNFTTLATQSAIYDAIGHVTLASVGTGGSPTAVTQYTYDAEMRLTCTAVRMNTNAFGSLPASACTAGAPGAFGADRITYNTYDAANHLTKVTSGYGTSVQRDDVTTTFGYDGETLSQADAKGNLTGYLYDGFDRLIQVNFPSPAGGGKTSGSDFESYAYDANSNVVSERRRDLQTIGYGYDARNRLTSGANGVTYGYDTLGRMTSASIAGQTTSYAWDALSRQVGESGPFGTLSRQFDLDGRRTRLTYPDGWSITYAYDPAGEVISISDSAVNLTNYGYDDLGRRTVVQRPGVATTAFTYGPDLRLSSLAHGFVDGGKNETYGFWYNAAGQLRSSTSSNAMYDWNAPANVGRNYAVDGQNRYTTSGSLNFAYDARANLSSDGVNAYAYDVTNRLTSLSNGATLSYDAPSRLFQTTGSSTTRFLYDGDQIVGEYDGSGNLLRRYVPGPTPDEPVVWYEGSGASDRRWLLADRQGSIVAVANSSGTTLGVNTYDDAGIPGSGNIGRFQYDAMAWIPEAGLYHDRARAYSPTLGRFMQSDPIGYGDGMNFFNFAHGDPVNGSDPSGLSVFVTCHDGSALFSFDGNGDPVPEDYIPPYCDVTNIPDKQNVSGGKGDDGGGIRSPKPMALPHNGPQNRQPPHSCTPAISTLAKIANVAETVSNGATATGLISAGAAVASSETIVGGITFGVVSGGAFTVSVIATVVAGVANVAAGRLGNAGVDAFALAFGGAAGIAAKEVVPAAQFVRNSGAALASAAASSICPG